MTKQDLKFALTHGGLIKDSQGKWMMHGDKVAFKDKHGNLKTGVVEFDADMLTWYVSGDEWTYLGWGWEEVYEIIKV